MRVVGIYRAYIPSILLTFDASLKYLSDIGELEYRSVHLKNVTSEVLTWGDVFFFGRSDSKMELRIARMLLKAGKRNLIYVLDDDLLNVPTANKSSSFYNSRYVRSVISEMIELCPVLASPSLKILEKYGRGKKTIHLEEPALLQPQFKEHDSNIIKIGYAGSLDHQKDIDVIILETLTRIKTKYSDRVEIEFFGAKPSENGIVDAACIPYEKDYLRYLSRLNERNWDIGLIPLIECEFNEFKHYIKAIEYMSLGIIPIASDVLVYHQFYELFGEIEIVKNNVDEWMRLISYYIEDSLLIEKKRKRCVDLSTKFILHETGQLLLQGINRILSMSYESNTDIKVSIPLIQYVFCRLNQVINVNGLQGCIKKILK